VIFNMTERDNGLENGKRMRALQPHEMFVSQRYATAVYRSELALRLEKLGYELERGKHGQPEVKGYCRRMSMEM
jgi:TrwC relaxase